MMKLIWKFIVPLLLVFAGFSVWSGDPNQPFSTTIPLVLGQYQKIVGAVLVIAGALVGIAVFVYRPKAT